ncbi:MAG: hypothetical protein ABFD24_07465 [Anaerolineaceae bacterium]
MEPISTEKHRGKYRSLNPIFCIMDAWIRILDWSLNPVNRVVYAGSKKRNRPAFLRRFFV